MPITRNDLKAWVFTAVRQLGGKARLIDVAKQLWKNHATDLQESGDLFFRWQYDMRWAAQQLRDEGKFKPADECPRGVWELA